MVAVVACEFPDECDDTLQHVAMDDFIFGSLLIGSILPIVD